jgi:hypothetical protein
VSVWAGLVAAVMAVSVACSPDASAAPARGIPAYDREAFGGGWADVDGDCQDTRNEILIRDLDGEQLDGEGCKVLSGTLHDLYTGATIPFRRGQGTSDDVQIDHVIPLAAAWRAGAWEWTAGQREAFANDPAELRAVDGPTNNRKRDRGPSTWLPPDEAAHCGYAAAWWDLAGSYGLDLDPADVDAIDGLLATC